MCERHTAAKKRPGQGLVAHILIAAITVYRYTLSAFFRTPMPLPAHSFGICSPVHSAARGLARKRVVGGTNSALQSLGRGGVRPGSRSDARRVVASQADHVISECTALRSSVSLAGDFQSALSTLATDRAGQIRPPGTFEPEEMLERYRALAEVIAERNWWWYPAVARSRSRDA